MTTAWKDGTKTTARLVGIFFIIGTAAGILSAVVTGPILDAPDYLTKVSVSEHQLIAGALLVLLMAFSLAMVPVLLFPLFRRQNEALALGAVVFRGALEAIMYIAIVVTWFLLLTLGRQYAGASVTAASEFELLGGLLLQAGVWLNLVLQIVFSLGALMIYYLFYQSELIPRWLSVWGILGGILFLAAQLSALFGSELGMLMIPLAVQEMILALWLIVKGFNKGFYTSV